MSAIASRQGRAGRHRPAGPVGAVRSRDARHPTEPPLVSGERALLRAETGDGVLVVASTHGLWLQATEPFAAWRCVHWCDVTHVGWDAATVTLTVRSQPEEGGALTDRLVLDRRHGLPGLAAERHTACTIARRTVTLGDGSRLVVSARRDPQDGAVRWLTSHQPADSGADEGPDPDEVRAVVEELRHQFGC